MAAALPYIPMAPTRQAPDSARAELFVPYKGRLFLLPCSGDTPIDQKVFFAG